MRSVSALRKLSTMQPASALPSLPTMQPASVLRSLRSIKPTTVEEAEFVPRFSNIVLSPNTQTMMLKKFAGTFVWYSAAVTVLWWPLIAAKIIHGEIAI